MNSYTLLLEKLLSLSEGHKEPLWSLRFFLRSQWKMVAPPAAQVIIPDL